ncbi:MAG: response regulator transcription factor [Halanaerobiales bacterium]
MDLHGKDILVIEDDRHIFALIKAMLKPYRVGLTLETDGKTGLERAKENRFDLVILDIMLPEKDGWEVCRELKNSETGVPIRMLTAKAEEADKVLGLEMGADDYVTKPFSPRELTARIKAVLRRFERSQNTGQEKLIFPDLDLEIDPLSYTARVKGEDVDLAPKEFELLVYLAQNPEQVFKREQLLDQIWGFDNYSETRTIDEHIKRLRKKLTQAGLGKIPLHTVWGVGYKFSTGEGNDEA